MYEHHAAIEDTVAFPAWKEAIPEKQYKELSELAILPLPELERAMRGDSFKVTIRGQERELMTDAELSEQGVDGADLHPGAAAPIAQVRGVDMVLPIGSEERQGGEPLDDVLARARSGEPLQQLLQNQPRRHDDFPNFQSLAQRFHFRRAGGFVTAQRERPNARIDEQAHRRERSAL